MRLLSIGSVTFCKVSKGDVQNSHFSPMQGDMVLMNINDVNLRRKLMRMPIMSECRLVIMVRINGFKKYIRESAFPQIIAWNTSPKDVLSLLMKVAGYNVIKNKDSVKLYEIFELLADEHPLTTISEKMQMSEKYTYAVKRRVLSKFGLSGCNSPVASLFCRDVLYIEYHY